MTLGRLDEDGATDLAIIAGNRLYILHGEDDEAAGYGSVPDERAGQLEAIAMPFGVKAAAVSDFIWDRDARLELAVAAEDGTVQIVARGTLDTRPFTVEEVRARRQLVAEVRRGSRPMSDLRGARPNAGAELGGGGEDLDDPHAHRRRRAAAADEHAGIGWASA